MALAANGKPTLSIAEAADRLTRDDVSWATFGGFGGPTTVTYSFRATAPQSMPEGVGEFQVFNAQQIRAAELAFLSWSDVANIRFSRIGSGVAGPDAYSDAGTLRLANYVDGMDGSAAFTYLPNAPANRASSSLQGDAWFNISLSYNADPEVLEYGQRVLVHEIGHALGLAHPSEYDATGDEPINYRGDADYYEDTRQYTVMSYFAEANTGASFRGYHAAAPLLHDIAGIQLLYGPNMSAFLGDTVYGFASNTDRPWFTAAASNSPLIFAVWDAGGVDTLNFSGFSQAQKIDLNPGAFSDVGGLAGNVAIAAGAVIENADGGWGADRIIGNAVANFIRGMDGNDNVAGGSGNDDVNGNVGVDTVSGDAGDDWVRGGRDNDVVSGGDGSDPHVNGNIGADTVYGGPGNDSVYGGQDNDQLFGEDGADLLSGDLGDDILNGGAGADRFVLRAEAGLDWVADFASAEGDRVLIAAGTAYQILTVADQAVIDIGGARLGLAGVSPGAMGDWLLYA